MMESADVVQAIFRALGIEGWEMVGMEPADAAILARGWDSETGCPRSRGDRGSARDTVMDRVREDRSGESGTETVLEPCFADDEA